MKNILKLSLVSLLVLGLNTTRVQADDEALAAIGGFVAGMITGAVIDHHSDRVHVSVNAGFGHSRDYRHARNGHWEIKRVQVWVPGRWIVKVDRCGDRIRIWEKGHYSWRRDRVWVSYDRRGYRDRGYRDYDRHDCDRRCDRHGCRDRRSYRG